jgi:hypothetical protein
MTSGGDANLTSYGGVYEGYWFAASWSAADMANARRLKRLSITYLEALTQLRCVATFGHLWAGRRILLGCDNKGAVAVINNAFTSDPHMCEVVRGLALLGMRFKCDLRAAWLDTKSNRLCDLLSRGAVQQAASEFSLDPSKQLSVVLEGAVPEEAILEEKHGERGITHET